MKRVKSGNAVMTAEEWNERHSVGTPVEVTRLRNDDGTPAKTFRSKTRSQAWNAGGSAFVKVEGEAGGYHLDFVRPLGDREVGGGQ